MTPIPDDTPRAPSTPYPVGKLPQADLIELLDHALTRPDPRVVFGPGLGRDAAVIDFGDRYLVTKTDPITFATDEIGWYVVNINANDVACLGAVPRWFIVTLLLPEGHTDAKLVRTIFDQLRAAGEQLGISVVGGHTEITHGIDRPIAVGAMFGEVAPEKLVRSDGGRAGDILVLTKGIAVEGTAILARDMADRLRDTVDPELLANATEFLHRPGLSVVMDAAIATGAGAIHAMHDPTEGGIATGIHEMSEAAGLGAEIDKASLPIYPETRAICDALGLDPLGIIASGSLLIAVAPVDVDSVTEALRAAGIAASAIGRLREAPGVDLCEADGRHPLRKFPRDEIARLFETPSSSHS